jgi:hypothetical protein
MTIQFGFRAFRRGLGLVDSYRSSIVILPCRSPPPIARRSPPPKSRRCAERDQVWYHVITCDFPETAAEWSEPAARPASVRRAKSSSIRRTSSGSSALRGETFAVSPPAPDAETLDVVDWRDTVGAVVC